jgi:hypothetical protein
VCLTRLETEVTATLTSSVNLLSYSLTDTFKYDKLKSKHIQATSGTLAVIVLP